ncbi:hypothetical protein [Intrasporangium sp.]|nr:hypothetical protein [Intrasporangium sp.]
MNEPTQLPDVSAAPICGAGPTGLLLAGELSAHGGAGRRPRRG